MKNQEIETVKLDKVIITIGFVFISLIAFIIARTPPASSYEISIYQVYPVYFWMLVIGTMFCGILVLIRNAFCKGQPSYLYLYGYFLLIALNLIIITLPIFRGYFIKSGGDEITHIGYIFDVLKYGHIGNTNIYPVSHILSSQIALIGGMDIRTVINILPVCFYILYMLGLLLLAKNVTRYSKQICLILAFGSVLLFTYFNYLYLPTQYIVYALPLFLYLFFKSKSQNDYKFNICLLIYLISLPFLHPLGSLLSIAILILINLSTYLARLLYRKKVKSGIPDSYSKINSWLPVIILFVIFFAWYSTFSLFKASVKDTFSLFTHEEIKTPISEITKGIAEVQYTLFDTIHRIVSNYGQDIIFGLVAAVAILFLLKKYFSRQNMFTSIEIFFSLCFVFLCIFALSTIFSSFLGTGSSLRLFCWPLVAAVLLNGLVYYDWISAATKLRKLVGVILISIAIIISAIIGMFNVYFSPIIDYGDAQVTYSEWQSMEWFYKYKVSYLTIGFDQLPKRYPDAVYGTDSSKPAAVGSFEEIPPRLGYDSNLSLKDTIKLNYYLVINEREKIVKKELRPNVGVYTIEDLKRVSSDNGVQFVYTSQRTDICFIPK